MTPPRDLDVAGVLAVVRPGVVAIRTQVVSPTSGGVQRGEGAGSGFVIDPDGTIVTNSHVVEGAHSISVELGNALGLEGDLTVTTGIVSAKDRDVQVSREVTLRGTIQTDAAINPGNSGGPLVDAQGRVVGINSAGALGAQSVGFAVPIDEAMPVIESLVRGEVPSRPFLGVQTSDLTDAIRTQAGIDREDGALVVGITPGSGAENAGIRVGDVIVGVHGRDVESSDDLGDAVSGADPGEAMEIRVDRGGRELTLNATVGARPGSVA